MLWNQGWVGGLRPGPEAPLVCPISSSLRTHLRQGGKLLLSPQHPSCPRSSPPLSAQTTWPRKAHSEPAADSRASGLHQQAAGSMVTCSLMSSAPCGHRRGRARMKGGGDWIEGKLRPRSGEGLASALACTWLPLLSSYSVPAPEINPLPAWQPAGRGQCHGAGLLQPSPVTPKS